VADTIRSLGLLERAVAPQQQALEIRRNVLGPEHPDTLLSINNMGRLLMDMGSFAEAEPLIREAVELLSAEESSAIRILTDASPQRLASFLCNLGRTRIGLGRPADLAAAEQNLLQAHALFEQIFGAEDPRTIDSVHALIELYQAREAAEPDGGHDAAAARWQTRLTGS